jgi:hypothetical protein
VPHIPHRFGEPLLRYTEFVGPILDFVRLQKADAASVLRTFVREIVGVDRQIGKEAIMPAAKRWRLKSIIHGIARTGPYRASKIHRTGADLTETNPKSLSGRMSDPANMRGRLPGPACHSRGRTGKPCGPRGNLAHLVAPDSDGARAS